MRPELVALVSVADLLDRLASCKVWCPQVFVDHMVHERPNVPIGARRGSFPLVVGGRRDPPVELLGRPLLEVEEVAHARRLRLPRPT